MARSLCAIFLLSVVVLEVYSKPLSPSSIKQCFKRTCPDSTFACEKKTKISDDRKHIVSEIKCLGRGGTVLDTFKDQEENIFGPNTDFQSYSFAGAWSFSSGNTDDDEVPPKRDNVDTESVEDNFVDSDKKIRKGAASEVEDMNASK